MKALQMIDCIDANASAFQTPEDNDNTGPDPNSGPLSKKIKREPHQQPSVKSDPDDKKKVNVGESIFCFNTPLRFSTK